jgi:hypothetical protein
MSQEGINALVRNQLFSLNKSIVSLSSSLGGAGLSETQLSGAIQNFPTRIEVTGTISNFATRSEVTGAINTIGGVTPLQVTGAISNFPTRSEVTGALTSYATSISVSSSFALKSDISSSFGLKTDISSSFGLKSDLTASYATKVQVTGAVANFATRSEVSGAITGSGIVTLNGNNTFTGINSFNNTTTVNNDFQVDYYIAGYTLLVDSNTHKVGIHTTGIPSYTLDVAGNGRYTDNLYLTRSLYVGPIINNLDNTPTTFGGISTIAAITANKFYLAPPGNDFTASFTNLPTDNLKVTTIDVYLSQSSAAKEITAVKVNNTSSNVNWLNNSIPMVNAYKIDVYTFNILRVSSNWLVTGELKTYG